jgi:hypothetical protein
MFNYYLVLYFRELSSASNSGQIVKCIHNIVYYTVFTIFWYKVALDKSTNFKMIQIDFIVILFVGIYKM